MRFIKNKKINAPYLVDKKGYVCPFQTDDIETTIKNVLKMCNDRRLAAYAYFGEERPKGKWFDKLREDHYSTLSENDSHHRIPLFISFTEDGKLRFTFFGTKGMIMSGPERSYHISDLDTIIDFLSGEYSNGKKKYPYFSKFELSLNNDHIELHFLDSKGSRR